MEQGKRKDAINVDDQQTRIVKIRPCENDDGTVPVVIEVRKFYRNGTWYPAELSWREQISENTYDAETFAAIGRGIIAASNVAARLDKRPNDVLADEILMS